MKAILTITFLLALLVSFTGKSLASNKNMGNNPNVVANYSDGSHTIILPDGTIAYGQTGSDLVLQSGNKNFEQFFEGTDGTNVHTLFHDVGSNTSCNSDEILLVNPYQPSNGDTWGFYFNPGDNYCVKSNMQ